MRNDARLVVLDQSRSTKPPEFGKTRPGLIVSLTVHNEVLDSVVVVPLSTVPGEIWPLRVKTDDVGGKASFAVLPGVRQVSKARLAEHIGAAAPSLLKRLDHALALALYLGD